MPIVQPNKNTRFGSSREAASNSNVATAYTAAVGSANGATERRSVGEQIQSAKPKHNFTHQEMLSICDKVYDFCVNASGIKLHPYQEIFARRIIQSVVMNDGDEITGLFSRQGGKTETLAVTCPGLAVLLPAMAKQDKFSTDSRFSKFKDGVYIGIFAPTHEQSGVLYSRCVQRTNSSEMREIMADPEIALSNGEPIKSLSFVNGSFIHSWSASPQSRIEGKTLHLIVCDETQDINNYKLLKSIHPMGAAVNATIVKIGTPATVKNSFYDSVEQNRRHDRDNPKDLKLLFEADYETIGRYNYNYKHFVNKQMERLGFDSDEFRMSYRLHWVLERGHYVTPEVFDQCAVKKRSVLKVNVHGQTLIFSRPDYPTTADTSTPNQIASIDIGRSNDSTLITVAKVWWSNPILSSGERRHYIHIVNWLEIQGDDHETQYPKILEFLSNYSIKSVVVDSTGRGDPIRSRLENDLMSAGIVVTPYVATKTRNHEAYTLLYQELKAKRVTFPAGPGAIKQRKVQRFMQQMVDLEKQWTGKFLKVFAPVKKESHDDYPDSLMMLVWLVNRDAFMTGETINAGTPFRTRTNNSAVDSLTDMYNYFNAPAKRVGTISSRLDRAAG